MSNIVRIGIIIVCIGVLYWLVTALGRGVASG